VWAGTIIGVTKYKKGETLLSDSRYPRVEQEAGSALTTDMVSLTTCQLLPQKTTGTVDVMKLKQPMADQTTQSSGLGKVITEWIRPA
jgi:hypothetical protein